MKTFIYQLLQWTWGLLQTFCGAIVFLTQLRQPHYKYKGAIVTNWRGNGASLSLGMFLFLDIPHDTPQTESELFLLAHEYGHTIQSLLLGPLYLLVIGLPSIIWAGFFGHFRQRRHCSYYVFYPEKWANYLGKKYTAYQAIVQNKRGG